MRPPWILFNKKNLKWEIVREAVCLEDLVALSEAAMVGEMRDSSGIVELEGERFRVHDRDEKKIGN